MPHIQLWAVKRDATGVSAEPAAAKDSTETESMLEELLVRSPALLAERLTLVGRQLPTRGGPLDLLGVDEDGRLVVFELKRGTLTRDAVAQVLDYASDLAQSDPEALVRLVQENSGRAGIEKFEDLEDWYSEQYPNSEGLLALTPKMVLVGLGVDERALRVVNFLSSGGMDVEVLTFHAFESAGQVFLARQVEKPSPVSQPKSPGGAPTKEGNLRILRESARAAGVAELLEDAATFIASRMPGYLWPGKTAYTLSLPERTAENRPTLRAYTQLYVDPKRTGAVILTFYERALNYAPEVTNAILTGLSGIARQNPKYPQVELTLNASNWPRVSEAIEPLLVAIVRARAAADDTRRAAADSDSVEE